VVKVAVVLSGCGVYDGAEIHESVLTLLRLAQRGATVSVFAPDIDQHHVVNHLTGEVVTDQSRNVLTESARIARGEIAALSTADPDAFDALIVPGGFGAAKNLSDFASAGAELTVEPGLLAFARALNVAAKPIGLICIAPTLAAAICGEGVECTIGDDKETAAAVVASGARHIRCTVGDICIDETRRLVTTPAYMVAENIAEAAEGIFKLVDAVLARA